MKKSKKPEERTLDCEVSGFSSADLLLFAITMVVDSAFALRFCKSCFAELANRGHLILHDEDPEEWNLPPEEHAKLVQHLGPSWYRKESLENKLFAILQTTNPWR